MWCTLFDTWPLQAQIKNICRNSAHFPNHPISINCEPTKESKTWLVPSRLFSFKENNLIKKNIFQNPYPRIEKSSPVSTHKEHTSAHECRNRARKIQIGSARREKGREKLKGRRRLADPVFKMADQTMVDLDAVSNLENRPFHRAYLEGKILFPHRSCRSDSAKACFYEEKGLAHHFRARHVGVVFDEEKQLRDARRLSRFLHGGETKRHLETLSQKRRCQVSIWIINSMFICTSQDQK